MRSIPRSSRSPCAPFDAHARRHAGRHRRLPRWAAAGRSVLHRADRVASAAWPPAATRAADASGVVDGGRGPARRQRPDRLLDGHRRPPDELGPADRRRDPARRRRAGTDALRRRRRPADAVRQDLSPVRPAARRSVARSRSTWCRANRPSRPTKASFTLLDVNRWSSGSSPSGRATSSAARPAARPERRRPAHRRHRSGRPAGAGRGLGHPRSPGLAGHRFVPPVVGAADGAARLGRRRRPAGHRRRDGGPGEPVRLPGR